MIPNEYEITSKSKFCSRNVRNFAKSRNMEGKPLGKHALSNVFYENYGSGLQTAFFDGFNVLLSFVAEK